MGYDPELADRIRDLVSSEEGLAEQPMFGGLAFLVHGHLAVSAGGHGSLLVRVDPMDADGWVDGAAVTRMVMRGRELRGWILVQGTAVSQTSTLAPWVDRGLGFARSLPPKSGAS